LRAKRLGQVVNYTTVYSGCRLKSSHTSSVHPILSVACSSRRPFDSVSVDDIQDVRCVYTSYDITIRSDHLDWPTAGIQLSAKS